MGVAIYGEGAVARVAVQCKAAYAGVAIRREGESKSFGLLDVP